MKAESKSIIIIAIANGIIAFGYSLSIPFLTLYLTTQKQVPAGVVGIMLALAMLTTAIASAISGEACDAFGRKKVMVVSLALRALSMLVIAGFIFFDAHYMWTMATHFAGCFLGAFFRPASNAWIADNTTPTQRIKAFGYIRIGQNLGWFMGPAVGGFLTRCSYSLGFASTGLTFFITTLYVYNTIKETLAKTIARKTNFIDMILALKDTKLAKLCTYNFLISIVSAQLVVGLSLHSVKVMHLSENFVGILFSAQGFTVVVLQYYISKLSSKISITSALALGCFLYAIGYGSVGFAWCVGALMAGVVVSAIGEMFVLPAGHSLASNIAPNNQRGRYLGLYVLSNQAGSAAGIFIAGVLMQDISLIYAPGPWLVVAAIGGAAGVLFYSLKRSLTREQNGLKPKNSVPLIKEMPS